MIVPTRKSKSQVCQGRRDSSLTYRFLTYLSQIRNPLAAFWEYPVLGTSVNKGKRRAEV